MKKIIFLAFSLAVLHFSTLLLLSPGILFLGVSASVENRTYCDNFFSLLNPVYD